MLPIFETPTGDHPTLQQHTMISDQMMYRIAVHEAGHAVAYVLAYRDLGQEYAAFERVLIRRDPNTPHVGRSGRAIKCVGIVEAQYIYPPKIGVAMCEQLPKQRDHIIRQMEWCMIISLAGPFAEAVAIGNRTKSRMRYIALFSCGSDQDYQQAERVLIDYKQVMRRQYGIGRFEDRARELVLDQWPAIDALAQALLKSDVLEYEAAHAIILTAQSLHQTGAPSTASAQSTIAT
jgi:hypothetical protein